MAADLILYGLVTLIAGLGLAALRGASGGRDTAPPSEPAGDADARVIHLADMLRHTRKRRA